MIAWQLATNLHETNFSLRSPHIPFHTKTVQNKGKFWALKILVPCDLLCTNVYRITGFNGVYKWQQNKTVATLNLANILKH